MALLGDNIKDMTGFILAGGKSRRMGIDKRYIELCGMTLLRRARYTLEEVLGRNIWIVGDNVSSAIVDPAYLLFDARPDCGPLGGLVSALESSRRPFCLLLAVDMPFLSVNDIRILISKMDRSAAVNALTIDGRPDPLAAIYANVTAAFWRKRLEDGELNLVDGMIELGWNPVYLPGTSRALTNLNYPGDLTLMDKCK